MNKSIEEFMHQVSVLMNGKDGKNLQTKVIVPVITELERSLKCNDFIADHGFQGDRVASIKLKEPIIVKSTYFASKNRQCPKKLRRKWVITTHLEFEKVYYNEPRMSIDLVWGQFYIHNFRWYAPEQQRKQKISIRDYEIDKVTFAFAEPFHKNALETYEFIDGIAEKVGMQYD